MDCNEPFRTALRPYGILAYGVTAVSCRSLRETTAAGAVADGRQSTAHLLLTHLALFYDNVERATIFTKSSRRYTNSPLVYALALRPYRVAALRLLPRVFAVKKAIVVKR